MGPFMQTRQLDGENTKIVHGRVAQRWHCPWLGQPEHPVQRRGRLYTAPSPEPRAVGCWRNRKSGGRSRPKASKGGGSWGPGRDSSIVFSRKLGCRSDCSGKALEGSKQGRTRSRMCFCIITLTQCRATVAQGDQPLDLHRSPGGSCTMVAQLGWSGEGEAVSFGRRFWKRIGSPRGPCQLQAGRGERVEHLGCLKVKPKLQGMKQQECQGLSKPILIFK